MNAARIIRLGHRYFGIIIGIQFVFWTISGLFFAWTNITEIRGDHLRKKASAIEIKDELIAPSIFLKKNTELKSLQLVTVFERPYYRVETTNKKVELVDAQTGVSRKSVSKKEAVRIADAALKNPSEVIKTDLLTSTNGHHEYRDKQLPAWAVEYSEPSGLVVYISADDGQVRSVRTSNWRIFDFLWMLHTMDFFTRDNINNWALRVFSVLGILMLVSGYLYWAITYRKVKWFRKTD